MAKKLIFNTVEEVKRASNALKDYHVEHVLVEYPEKKDKSAKMFIVVMNKELANAVAALKVADLHAKKTKGYRHYEMAALQHKHYQPKFECVCRECGKKFMHVVKDAVWCSSDCKKKFRNARREERLKAKAEEERRANEEAKQSADQDS